MNWKFTKSKSEEAISFYNKNGFVGFKDLLTRNDVNNLIEALNEAQSKGAIKYGVEKVENCNDIVFAHKTFMKYASHKPIIELLVKIIGAEIELQHSKLNSKPTNDQGGGEFKWHQDFPFFPHTNFDLIAVCLHLDDQNEDSGPLKVIPKSHKSGPLSHCKNGEFVYECTENINYKNEEIISLTGKAGMVSFHDSLILHSSKPKKSKSHRRLLFYQYRSKDNCQLSGVIWKSYGIPITKENKSKGKVRFQDGTVIENRGVKGKLFDKYQRLKPDV